MFIVTLTYVVDLAVIDASIREHGAWLDQQYDDGVFIASGRREPRTGGVILVANTTLPDLEDRLAGDPFSRRGFAEYSITQFTPSRTANGFEALLS